MLRNIAIVALIFSGLLAGQANATTFHWSFDGFARNTDGIIGNRTISGLLELAGDGDGTFAATSVKVTSDSSEFLNLSLSTLAMETNFAETSFINRFTVLDGEIVDGAFTSEVRVNGVSGADSGLLLVFAPDAFLPIGIGVPTLLSNVGRSDTAFGSTSLPTFSQVSAVPLPAGFWLLVSALAGLGMAARYLTRDTEDREYPS